uniref:Myb-like domain-containing protein n=1 Tax=Clytia hemisphaerica TaxID=252671 RepID=A0A7M5VGN6_9CNID
MPALEPHDQMEPITALDEDQQIPSPTKSEQDTNNTVANNNNNNSNTTNGESYNGITKYNPSTPSDNGSTNDGFSPRPNYEQSQQPVYMSTLNHTQPAYRGNFHRKIEENNNTHHSPRSNGNFHRPYQTSPPSIDKAPSFVVRSLSESSKSTTPPSPSTSPPEDKHVWSKGEIELLLDLYESYKDQLKDPRVRKTKVWDDVARIIREKVDSDVTGCQCNQKFRNLKADFQKVLDHNGRPGNFKRVCKYYDRLANILSYQAQGRGYPGLPHPYPPLGVHENAIKMEQRHRELFFENGRSNSSPKPNMLKRKLSQENLMMNGHHPMNNGHVNGHVNGHPPPSHEMLYPIDNKRPKTQCTCDCSHEVTTLRDTVERINNYIVARAAHEEERMRRVEEMHREKLVALSRFVDIFKDFVMKMT